MRVEYPNRHGFTIMEIVVAIFMFSVLFTVLFGSFRMLSSSSDTLGKGTLQFQMGQQCISRIAVDIETIKVAQAPLYKQPELRDSSDPYRVEGIADDVEGNIFSRFRFTSFSHFSFGMVHNEGVAEIVYYVTRLDHGEYVLRRSDSLYPFAEFEEKNTDPIVCKQIQEFSVTYYDNEGEEYEEWDSESSEYDYATPRFVQIDLQIGEKDAPMAFHTRINIPVYREKPASMS